MSKPPASKPPLTDSEIRELISLAQAGDFDAREKVFYIFIPLAYSRAQKFDGYGVPLEDLRQEACYGLLLALDHYDVKRPETFATLARHYIDKYTRKAVQNQNSTIPGCYKEDLYYDVKAYLAAKEDLRKEIGYEPSEQEMAAYMNLSLLRLRRIKRAAETLLQPGLDCDLFWIENHFDKNALRPLEDMYLKGNSPWEALDADVQLTVREKEVLERRFGFTASREPETFPRMSAEMGLSLNTLKNTYRMAIEKIRVSMGL